MKKHFLQTEGGGAKSFKIGTVCSGIGSPEVAIRKHNHSIAFACEIDKYARASYTAIHGEVPMFTDMTSDDFHSNAGYCDLFVGGIPCQAFSLAGKRLGELDKRGLLFYDFYKYVQNYQPKVFIIENVKGLLSDAGGKTFQNWLLLLGNSVNGHTQMFGHPDSLGYNLHHTVLNSKDFGVPQNRERVFLVGIRSDLPNDFRFPKGWKLDKRLKDVLEVDVDEKYYLSEKALEYMSKPSTGGYSDRLTFMNDEQNQTAGCITANHSKGIPYNCLKVSTPTNLQGKDLINTIRTGGRGSLTDKHSWDVVIVPEATKQGFAIAEPYDSINLSNPNSQTRRGRVGKGIANTLDTACNQAIVEPKLTQVAQMEGFESEGRIYDSNGLSRTIKNGGGGGAKTGWYKIDEVVQLNPSKESVGKQPYQQNRIYDSNAISPVLNTECHRPSYMVGSRIRRLTPLECWRLQGFSDADFYKAQQVNSDTQLYKQAGNSITTNVMEAIIDKLVHLLN